VAEVIAKLKQEVSDKRVRQVADAPSANLAAKSSGHEY
jgi:hypothetical protein